MSETDVRGALYRDAEACFTALRQPGTGQVSDAVEIHAAPNGRRAVFTGTIVEKLEGTLPTHLCEVDLETGDVSVLTSGANSDRLPRYSPDGLRIAFLSDRHEAGNFQLYLFDLRERRVSPAPHVSGWVEYLQWSPDGRQILLGVAGRGADIPSVQGALTSARSTSGTPGWMPLVETGDETYRWRRAWIYDVHTMSVREVESDGNVWEAAWCGNGALAAVVSDGPVEGHWFSARLQMLDTRAGTHRELYIPQAQLGCVSASPSGSHVAVVEAICSDRWMVAGALLLIETAHGSIKRVDTRGVDIACMEWRSDRLLLLAGHRGFETVVGLYDVDADLFTELWSSHEITSGGRYIAVSGLDATGDCVLVGEGFTRAPEIARISRGIYSTIRSFDLGYHEQAKVIGAVERVSWRARDGLGIQGWLLKPRGAGPYPVVMDVHGGPVWHWRPRWLGRMAVYTLMLLNQGYAVFLPNPRGSSGRGQDFARRVLGDVGGEETGDHLSGLDHLVAQGLADPSRIGVTGGSHGGFMSAWLITQSDRFAAAVPLAPVTNHVSQHLMSNIPHFVASFLGDRYDNPHGSYFERSPIMHARKARAPTLNICGALDRCTPPAEAAQFHNALLENGTPSVLVTYPEEGHGIRKLPAVIDYTARLVAWFCRHMPSQARKEGA